VKVEGIQVNISAHVGWEGIGDSVTSVVRVRRFLLPAVQAKVTLTSERTRGWRGLQSAPSEAFLGVIMYKM
jgi:hypothetical protein